MKQKVLLTGAAGIIGSGFRLEMNKRYHFRLADLNTADLEPEKEQGHEVFHLDITDAASCSRACEGMDAVIHLAGIPYADAEFDPLLEVNIKGTYFMFEAAAKAGIRRFVFASSAQVNEGYDHDVQTHESQPLRPGNLYGVSKCFGEALGAHFAYQHGLSTVVVRIANYLTTLDAETCSTPRDTAAFLSPRDANQLLVRCLETADILYTVVNATSNNRFKRLDITRAREQLGYRPEDDAFQMLGL